MNQTQIKELELKGKNVTNVYLMEQVRQRFAVTALK